MATTLRAFARRRLATRRVVIVAEQIYIPGNQYIVADAHQSTGVNLRIVSDRTVVPDYQLGGAIRRTDSHQFDARPKAGSLANLNPSVFFDDRGGAVTGYKSPTLQSKRGQPAAKVAEYLAYNFTECSSLSSGHNGPFPQT